MSFLDDERHRHLPAAFYVPEPQAKATLVAVVDAHRGLGTLRSEQESRVPVDWAVFAMSRAAGRLRYLAEVVRPEGVETKAGARRGLLRLGKALEERERVLTAWLEDRAEDVGFTASYAVLAVEFDAAGNSIDLTKKPTPRFLNDFGVPLPAGREALRRMIGELRAQRPKVSAAADLLSAPGRERGSPEVVFAREALGVWMRLDRSDTAPVRQPMAKHFAEWLAAGFVFAALEPKLDPAKTAGRVLNEFSRRLREGDLVYPPPPSRRKPSVR